MNHMNKTILALFALIATNASLAGGDAYIKPDADGPTTDSCIITDYTVKSNTKIEFDFELTDLHDSNILFGHYSLGTENTHMRTFMLYCQKDGSKRWFRMQARDGGWINEYARATTNIQDKARHIAVIDLPKKKYAFDGVENETVKPTEATLGSAPCPLTFFARPTNESATGLSQATAAKIYGVKLWESSDNGATYELVRDYIPAISNYVSNSVSNSVYGLYDRVNKAFVTSKTSGTLKGGGTGIYNVTNPSSSDPYIQSSGEQAIDTGYKVKRNNRIVVDFEIVEKGGGMTVFGTYPSDSGSELDLACVLWQNDNGNLESNVGGKPGGWSTARIAKDALAVGTRYKVDYDLPGRIVRYFINGEEIESSSGYLYRAPWTIPGTNVTDRTENALPIALFAQYKDKAGTSFDKNGKYRIYSFKVWEDDKLVLDYIPAERDGVAGFYDLVNNEFKSSDTGTELTRGGGEPYALPHMIRDAEGTVKADVCDYMQSGLVLHLDGKRNVGTAAEHNASALTWTDLSGFGADASLYHGTPADGSAWESDGYNFVSNTYGRLANSLPITSNLTIQIACDADANDTPPSWSPINYPKFVAAGDKDYCAVYRDTYPQTGGGRYNAMKFKCQPGGDNSPFVRPQYVGTSWPGKYLTAIRVGDVGYLTHGLTRTSGVSYSSSDGLAAIPAGLQWCVGGQIDGSGNPKANSYLYATKMRAVRVYDRALSDDELVRNRIVDDVRYTGDITQKRAC